MTDRVVIFLHLPKAAGSTLNRVIAQQHPASAIYKVAGNPKADSIREIAEGTREGGPIRVITGHAGFGTHAAVARPFTYITVLRDPVERLLSHYHFARTLESHPLHAEIVSGGLTLPEAARRLANMQTRYLADESARGAITGREALASAKDNLTRHFAVAGIAERFDETLVLLQRRLGWKVGAVANSNVTHGRPARTAHTAEDLEAIRAVNEIDLELYEWARDRFEKEIAGEGLGLRAAVTWLKIRKRARSLVCANSSR